MTHNFGTVVMLAVALVGLGWAAPEARSQAIPPADAPVRLAPSPLLDVHGAWRQGRSVELLAILDEQVEWTLRNSPVDASQRGDERYNDQLGDASPAATVRRTAEAADRLRRLGAINASTLGEADRLDADLLRYELEDALAGASQHLEQLQIDARSGPQVGLSQMCDSLPFKTAKQYADYATRLERIPEHVEQVTAQLRAGLSAGRVPSRVVMAGTAEQCFMLATEDVRATPSLSPFYKPYRGLAAGAVGFESAARARKAIAERVAPAFQKFGEFLRDEYAPKCRETVGYSQGVDGPAAYDLALRRHTTTKLTAEQIHALGLSEVARIHAEMMGVIARTDFSKKGALSGEELFRAFVEYLRTDKRFYYDKPEELLTGYREICKRMDAELPRLFGKLPRLSYGVRELPAIVAPTSPTAYYYLGSMKAGVPGWFMANTYRLDQRPKYEMTALALHESVPGHHLQISLSQELEGQHPFRTFTNYTAFVEGWGLYSERLGLEVGGSDEGEGGRGAHDESGAGSKLPVASAGPEGNPPGTGGAPRRSMYSDPYDDFGRLSYEMWRACRLVVDTGMHAKGWSRERAIGYMLENTSLSALNIEREVDRYIAWPGQACAYKIGQLKISELRARAEKALGPRFDVRAFHDAALGSGSIPLPTLEAKIDRWIAAQN
jgi:uncharacterized protein (DUF885 family)